MDPRIEPYVRASGLYYLTEMGYTRSDHRLLQALTERWRPETNTFHLRHGEMTITLQDVAILTGLPIDGKPVLSWLKETFSIVPDVELDDDILQQYARAYILFVLGSTIFADGTGNKIHACYLHLFRDFEDAGRYSWGAAALAHLYRALYRGSVLGERMSAGYFVPMQLWSWERLHVGRPSLHDPDFILGDRPLGARWQPYSGTYETLPPACMDHMELWTARVPLICFDIVEMHVPDRVARQFGWHQDIPSDVEAIDRVNRRGRQDVNWIVFHQTYIERWDQRLDHIHQFSHTRSSRRYMEWYWERTVRHITPPPPPQYHPGYVAPNSVRILNACYIFR
ncbi:hypothetical protein QJS04_geneDACA017817 [Acorus gramineus]|uniref:Aminotransferase-like plant mobile domain-containing protein n=1 Tax=Acorus gramineus TaxID=55184 RepID=A0AAV9A398_ACOGR|nr:hypothetical protein QJS04_geneDACA017817 [Acorus gramineus]